MKDAGVGKHLSINCDLKAKVGVYNGFVKFFKQKEAKRIQYHNCLKCSKKLGMLI